MPCGSSELLARGSCTCLPRERTLQLCQTPSPDHVHADQVSVVLDPLSVVLERRNVQPAKHQTK